jgi:hypothetical protein
MCSLYEIFGSCLFDVAIYFYFWCLRWLYSDELLYGRQPYILICVRLCACLPALVLAREAIIFTVGAEVCGTAPADVLRPTEGLNRSS